MTRDPVLLFNRVPKRTESRVVHRDRLDDTLKGAVRLTGIGRTGARISPRAGAACPATCGPAASHMSRRMERLASNLLRALPNGYNSPAWRPGVRQGERFRRRCPVGRTAPPRRPDDLPAEFSHHRAGAD